VRFRLGLLAKRSAPVETPDRISNSRPTAESILTFVYPWSTMATPHPFKTGEVMECGKNDIQKEGRAIYYFRIGFYLSKPKKGLALFTNHAVSLSYHGPILLQVRTKFHSGRQNLCSQVFVL